MGSRATGGDVETVGVGLEDQPQIVMLADGGWIVVYRSEEIDASSTGIAFRRFDAFGNPTGPETPVNAAVVGLQQRPSIALLADGGWIVAWMSPDDSSFGIYQQRFDADGNRVGEETRVNTFTIDSQEAPTITGLPDGGWLVTWHSQDQDGSLTGVYQQRFDADGLAVGTETLVNTETLNHQATPDVTVLADGGWLVCWSSGGQDGSSNGVYQQRFDAAGQPVGGETLVNTTTLQIQYEPQTVALSDGGWIVVWTSLQDADTSQGIFYQRFDADGGRIGDETQVHATTANIQEQPHIATLADGGWVVVWRSAVTGGMEIFQRRYDSDGEPVGGETLVSLEPGLFRETPVVVGLPDGSWTVSWAQGVEVVQRHYAPDIVGGAGNDELTGTQWDEALFGNAGNDFLDGGFGDDVLVGGFGDDQYIVDFGNDDVREFVGQGHDTVNSRVTFSMTGDAVEDLYLVGATDIDGFGNSSANAIYGNLGANDLFGYNNDDAIDGDAGNDLLSGGAGHDSLTGGAGDDRLIGGSGVDTAIYAAAASGVTVNLGLTTNQNTGGAGTDRISDVENLVGSGFDDLLTGDDDANVVEGGAGDDTMTGLLGIDTLSYGSAGAGVEVRLGQTNTQNTLGAGFDTASGFENLVGSAFDDFLAGDAGDNVIEGGDGDDTIDGNAGVDTASYASAASAVIVTLTVSFPQQTFGAGGDALDSIENLIGSAFDDTLTGSAARNRLDGGAGDDMLRGNERGDNLIGGWGKDLLFGGADADRFIFDDGDLGRTEATTDVIQDFDQAEGDRIAVSQIDADTNTAGNQDFAFVGTAAFTGTAGELRQSTDGIYTVVSGDTNGDGFADFAIYVLDFHTLTTADFIL